MAKKKEIITRRKNYEKKIKNLNHSCWSKVVSGLWKSHSRKGFSYSAFVVISLLGKYNDWSLILEHSKVIGGSSVSSPRFACDFVLENVVTRCTGKVSNGTRLATFSLQMSPLILLSPQRAFSFHALTSQIHTSANTADFTKSSQCSHLFQAGWIRETMLFCRHYLWILRIYVDIYVGSKG